jgi:hypothetical protein
MMRLPLAAALVALVAGSLPANAQSDAGCEETNPCALVLDVDADGFSNPPDVSLFTQGDWWEIDVFNLDDEEHVVTIDGFDVSVTVPPGENVASGGFEFDVAGSYNITDSPSGDSLPIEVTEGDAVEEEEEPTDPGRETDEDDSVPGDSDNGTPGLGAALTLVTLAAMALARRRGL